MDPADLINRVHTRLDEDAERLTTLATHLEHIVKWIERHDDDLRVELPGAVRELDSLKNSFQVVLSEVEKIRVNQELLERWVEVQKALKQERRWLKEYLPLIISTLSGLGMLVLAMLAL